MLAKNKDIASLWLPLFLASPFRQRHFDSLFQCKQAGTAIHFFTATFLSGRKSCLSNLRLNNHLTPKKNLGRMS
jgi:hypothetical protein